MFSKAGIYATSGNNDFYVRFYLFGEYSGGSTYITLDVAQIADQPLLYSHTVAAPGSHSFRRGGYGMVLSTAASSSTDLSFKPTILAVAGGAGSGGEYYGGAGGQGGGETGGNGVANTGAGPGYGGSQTAGGSGYIAGTFMLGGNGHNGYSQLYDPNPGGSGGGGYYGGGGAYQSSNWQGGASGGGGGSGHVNLSHPAAIDGATDQGRIYPSLYSASTQAILVGIDTAAEFEAGGTNVSYELLPYSGVDQFITVKKGGFYLLS